MDTVLHICLLFFLKCDAWLCNVESSDTQYTGSYQLSWYTCVKLKTFPTTVMDLEGLT